MSKIEKLQVNLKSRSYPIYIGMNLLADIEKLIKNYEFYSKIIIVTDTNIKRKLNYLIISLKSRSSKAFSLITLPAGEKTKSFNCLQFLCEKILQKKIDRKTLLISMGGGVVGDIVGLTASLLLRGIDFIQVPTTLLAQVDSSVGGKTAINTKFGKNLIGTFNQPKAVIISLETLKSLPKRQLLAGYAEILKYSLIKDKSFFDWLKKNGGKLISLDQSSLIYGIKKSCKIKSTIVSEDERELGIREILNFGHTFGHAIESLTGFSNRIIHGEAIFLGMFLALKYSDFLGFCKPSDIGSYKKHLSELKIPFKLSDYNLKFKPKAFLEHLKFDKKISNSKIKFILLKQYGKTVSYIVDNEKILMNFLEKNLKL
jgi:3-dehydroquinate synthase